MTTPFLETKLYLPELASDTVDRPRLLQHLGAGLRARLTLICAPPGSGKTTVAAAWLHSLTRPSRAGDEAACVAWYTVDGRDNDLTSFVRYVTAAIRRACPNLLPGWIDLDRRVSMPEPEEVAAELIAALVPGGGQLFLALDDYHFVTDPAVHLFVTYFLRHLPPHVHVVITARYEPPIDLPQLRARRQIVELSSAELAFTLEEAAAFLHGAIGDDIDPADVDTLWRHTEGWLAGLRLAIISLQVGSDRQQFVRRFAQANTRHIADYLVDQVLATQPEAVHDFLLQSSILSRLSRDLCAAVVPQHSYAGKHILDYLHHYNVFLIPLDDFDEWYRYHGQFRSMLQKRLVSQYAGGEVAILHWRAAEWFASQGHMEDAVLHYVAAGDAGCAAVLVERLIPELLRRGQWHQSSRYLALLPAETVKGRPALLLLRAWTCVQDYDLAQIRLLVEQAESLLQDGGGCPEGADPAKEAALRGQISALRARGSLGRVPWEESLAYGQEALRLLPPCHVFARAFALNAMSIVVLALHGYAAVREMIDAEIAANHERRTGYVVGPYYIRSIVCYVAGMMDEFEAAYVPYAKVALALDMPTEVHLAKCMAGMLQLERNNLKAAYELLSEVVSRPDLTLVVGLRVAALPLLEIYAERGLIAQGKALLSVLHQRMEKSPDPQGIAETDALDAFWAVLNGDRSAAEQYLRRAPLQETPFLHLSNRGIIQICICHALGRPADLQQAADLAQRLADTAGKYHHTHVEVRALVLLAQTYWLRNLPVRALAALRRALSVGYPRGFRRTLCTPGPMMDAMLRQLAAEDAFAGPVSHLLGEIARLDKLKSGVPPHITAVNAHTQTGSPGHQFLSRRESAILSLLATDMTNQAIADLLNISLHTVRNHTANIYRKLGVQNRSEAQERVRLWGQADATGIPAGEGEMGAE